MKPEPRVLAGLLRCAYAAGSGLAAAVGASAQTPCAHVPTAAVFPQSAAPSDDIYAVATNASGDRLLTTSPRHDLPVANAGAVWVISNPGSAAQSDVRVQPTTCYAEGYFGNSIAIDAAGDVLVAGAKGSGYVLPRTYIFRFDGTNWIEEWNRSGPFDDFGWSVAISGPGDVVAIGAPGRMVPGPYGAGAGAVEVYRHQSGGWIQEWVYEDPWGGYSNLGAVVALSADGRVLATRSHAWINGTVFVFERIAGAWTQVAALHETVAHSTGGFGSSLGLDADGETLAVGSYADGRAGYLAGAVLIYRKGAAGWALEQEILPPGPAISGALGRSIAINAAGDRILAAAPSGVSPVGGVGTMFEYECDATGWQTRGQYFSPAPSSNSEFAWVITGNSLATSATGRRWMIYESRSDLHALDAGIVHVFDSPCTSPVRYCTAQTNFLGCVPQIDSQGSPSASSPSGFTVSLSNTRNQQNGLLFYGTNGGCSLPWKGGTLCVQPPLVRTPLQSAGGNALPAADCSGAFALDFNAWTSTGLDPALFPGQHVRAQYYSRDPGATSNVNLSDALEFYLEP